ncbi:MAG TPA: hypothetical protein VJ552_06620 [Sediminibacterium sp.]|nr:hypothetical protein [Sediminibacterium sp.]
MMRQSGIVLWMLLGYLFAGIPESKAGDTLMATQLLHRIAALQPKQDGIFPKGLFPSFRTYALNKHRQKADINIFYTGLISFTLKNLRKDFTPYQQRIADDIIRSANAASTKFKNKKGRDTYNFWPTDTPRIFPNSGWMNWFDKQQALPDDLDDTVILLLALNADDSVAAAIHNLMQQFVNNGQKQVNNTFKSYRNIGAYSTWFGKKMPVDFDVSVLSNVLYFVQSYSLPWTAADTASLQLIDKVIGEKKYLTDAAYVSPHYSSPAIILYHFSRLMQLKPIASLEANKATLIADAAALLQKPIPFMEQVLLQTALFRWGVQPATIQVNNGRSLEELVEDESFSFFIANMASMLPGGLKKAAGGAGVGKFYYFCPAFNNLLLLENLVWHRRQSVSLQP